MAPGVLSQAQGQGSPEGLHSSWARVATRSTRTAADKLGMLCEQIPHPDFNLRERRL